MWDIQPFYDLKLIAIIGLVLTGLAVLQMIQEHKIKKSRRYYSTLILRIMLIIAVLFILINPVKIAPLPESKHQKLVVLLDQSASMATTDTDIKLDSRFKTACKLLSNPEVHDSLESEFTMIYKTFDRNVTNFNPGTLNTKAPDGLGTNLNNALLQAISELDNTRDNAGILLISDGRWTKEKPFSATQMALAREIPIWTLCIGKKVDRQDVWLSTPAEEMLAFSNDKVILNAVIHQTGYPKKGFKLDLLKDGKIIDSKSVMPDSNKIIKAGFKVTAPQKGEHCYTFRVPSQPGEAYTQNNSQTVYLRVVGEKVKILLVEGQPHWDTKFLVQTLKQHPRVDLTAVYRLGSNRYSAVVSKQGKFKRKTSNLFPETKKEMFEYDILILGRECETFISKKFEDIITAFVSKQGGGLVFSRGKPYSSKFYALAKLEPVIWGNSMQQNVNIMFPESALYHPVFRNIFTSQAPDKWVEQMPELSGIRQTKGKKPLAHTLITTRPGPDNAEQTILMAYQRYGQGKSVTLNMNGMWQWAFQLQKDKTNTLQFERFWMSLLRWLLEETDFLPGTDISLRSAKRYYTDEQKIRLAIMTRGLPSETYLPRLTVQGEDFNQSIEPIKKKPNLYTAIIGPLAPGTYDIVLNNNIGAPETITTKINIVPPGIEFRNLSANPEIMEHIAKTTNARTLSANDIVKLPKIVHKWKIAQQMTTQKKDIWDHWALLAIMLAFMGIEWFLRRKKGLL